MYKYYKVYVGRYATDNQPESIDKAISDINENSETIISVTSLSEGYWVLIVTRTADETFDSSKMLVE